MLLLWGDAVIGWANLTFAGGQLQVALGYAGSPHAARPSSGS
jgi:hypothetical protein